MEIVEEKRYNVEVDVLNSFMLKGRMKKFSL